MNPLRRIFLKSIILSSAGLFAGNIFRASKSNKYPMSFEYNFLLPTGMNAHEFKQVMHTFLNMQAMDNFHQTMKNSGVLQNINQVIKGNKVTYRFTFKSPQDAQKFLDNGVPLNLVDKSKISALGIQYSQKWV